MVEILLASAEWGKSRFACHQVERDEGPLVEKIVGYDDEADTMTLAKPEDPYLDFFDWGKKFLPIHDQELADYADLGF